MTMSESEAEIIHGDHSKDSDAVGEYEPQPQFIDARMEPESETEDCPLPSVPLEDLTTCERCGKEVVVWEMPEHNDYHFALDLHNSLTSSINSAANTSGSISSSSTNASPTPLRGTGGTMQSSRGKTRTRGQSGPAPKRQRSQGGSMGTLDAFFKKN